MNSYKISNSFFSYKSGGLKLLEGIEYGIKKIEDFQVAPVCTLERSKRKLRKESGSA